jgi:adenylyl-sulfate kinase
VAARAAALLSGPSSEGFVVWLTGLPGAGKSTLAQATAQRLRERGVEQLEILDGDELRRSLSRDLGFSHADRETHVRRVAYVANLLARHGVAVLVPVIAPYRETRAEVRASIGRYAEVYVRCPLEELKRRDPKGLYAAAARGEVEHLTGVSDPYEEPESPEVVVDTDRLTVDECTDRIIATLQKLGLSGRLDPRHT